MLLYARLEQRRRFAGGLDGGSMRNGGLPWHSIAAGEHKWQQQGEPPQAGSAGGTAYWHRQGRRQSMRGSLKVLCLISSAYHRPAHVSISQERNWSTSCRAVSCLVSQAQLTKTQIHCGFEMFWTIILLRSKLGGYTPARQLPRYSG